MSKFAAQKDAKKQAPPKPGVHPHPVTPSRAFPAERKVWPAPVRATPPPTPPVRWNGGRRDAGGVPPLD